MPGFLLASKITVTHIRSLLVMTPTPTLLNGVWRMLSLWAGEFMKAAWSESTVDPTPTFSPMVLQFVTRRLSDVLVVCTSVLDDHLVRVDLGGLGELGVELHVALVLLGAPPFIAAAKPRSEELNV